MTDLRTSVYAALLPRFSLRAALILGVWTRIVALALTPILFDAIVTGHGADGWLFTNTGGGWKYLTLWTAALVALTGDGAWALRPTPAVAGRAKLQAA